jgi:hypothetical protein
MNFWIMRRWYQMKISALWEEGGNRTPASPARVVQYEGVHGASLLVLNSMI